MAYGSPANPVSGTVITVAYAVANLLDPIRWLRLLTGNADPPGSSYVVLSNSVSGTSWSKVTNDALADRIVTSGKMGLQSVINETLGDDVVDDRVLTGGAALANIGAAGVSAGYLAPGVAVANIGYTPLATDGHLAMTGRLAIRQNTGTNNGFTALELENPAASSAVLIKLIAGPSTAVNFGFSLVPGNMYTFGILDGTGAFVAGLKPDGHFYINNGTSKVWDALNDGAGSGLDADLLDGRDTGTTAGTIAFYDAAGKVANALTADTAGAATLAGTASTAQTATLANTIADGAVSTTAKLANVVVTAAKIALATITDAQIAAANKDGVAATASLRTIGLGAQQAAAGNHGHTSMAHVDSGTYTGNGGGPFVIVATLVYKPSVVHFQLSSSGGSINNGYAFMGSNAKVTLFAVGGGITDGNVGALGVGSVTIPASLNVNGIIYNWTSIG